MKRMLLLICILLLFMPLSWSQEFTKAIEDNSFFIEEAYNQEYRVVQHISTGYYEKDSKTFTYTFTQEWPIDGQTHQLSYTIPYQSMYTRSSGVGDILINYRYQLWDDKDWGWLAPRLSLILPTGNSVRGLGSGVLGMQVCIPLSKRWSDAFITHFNIGGTLLPHVSGSTIAGTDVKHTLPSYSLGASGIWLLNENFNVLCEILHNINSSIDPVGNVVYESETIVSPGIRFAINFGNLQIVPGVAAPIMFGANKPTSNIYGYLSFEHPF